MREDSRGKEGQKRIDKPQTKDKNVAEVGRVWRGNTEFTDVEKEGDEDQGVEEGCHETKTRRSNRTMRMKKAEGEILC